MSSAAGSTSIAPGQGQVLVSRSGQRAVFGAFSFRYPLKLLAPTRHFVDRLACLYIVSYGGGLVAGDTVTIHLAVTDGTSLVCYTQGSTKVFKTRPGRPLASQSSLALSSKRPSLTRQLLSFTISPDSTLYLLPAPVTCFSRALYAQKQVFRLADTSSSLLLLDWFTSGRSGMGDGEAWDFDYYRSENEIWLAEQRIVKDVMLLEDERAGVSRDSQGGSPPAKRTGRTTYASRVEPYSCYANLFLFGPRMRPLLEHFKHNFSSIMQYKTPLPYSLIWSFSELAKEGGGVVRIAGASTEEVKDWIGLMLKAGRIEDLLGTDLWNNFI